MLFSEKKTKKDWRNPLTWFRGRNYWEYKSLDNPAGEITLIVTDRLEKDEIDLIAIWVEKQSSGEGNVEYKKESKNLKINWRFIKNKNWE